MPKIIYGTNKVKPIENGKLASEQGIKEISKEAKPNMNEKPLANKSTKLASEQ